MNLGQVAFSVKDLPSAVAFYENVLGLPKLFSYPNLAFFDMGGVRLMLSAASAEGTDAHEAVLYYRVDDLNAAWQALSEKGARPEKEPHLVAKMSDHDLWMAFVRDPDQRLVGIMSEVRN